MRAKAAASPSLPHPPHLLTHIKCNKIGRKGRKEAAHVRYSYWRGFGKRRISFSHRRLLPAQKGGERKSFRPELFIPENIGMDGWMGNVGQAEHFQTLSC